MFRVLIVDDKEIFRRRIRRLSYWKEHADHFQIVWEADNGVDALEIMKNNQVDAVITDIRMPMIDGIELLKRNQAEGYCRCVILLSEYADFEYAKQGIVNGAFDYILKPADNEKITDAMERAYGYLSRLSDQHHNESSYRVDSLVSSLIKADVQKTEKYANRIYESIHTSPDSAAALLREEEIMKQVRKELINDLSYLENYIPAEKEFVQNLPESVRKLSDEISPFLIKGTGSAIRQISESVLKNPAGAPSLQQLADEYHMNVKYLGEQFKKETGQGYLPYVLFLKMSQAALRLRTDEEKIYEIAYDLGYDDLDYFSKCFKKVMGVSPKAYRSQIYESEK